MKQYDLDALGMRLERISGYLAETACLVRIWADIENNDGFNIYGSDASTLACLVVKYINRIHRDFVSFKRDFEFPPSSRHC